MYLYYDHVPTHVSINYNDNVLTHVSIIFYDHVLTTAIMYLPT